METGSLKSELAELAASVHAYIEWQGDTGADGIPVGIPHLGRAPSTHEADVASPAHEAPAPAKPVHATTAPVFAEQAKPAAREHTSVDPVARLAVLDEDVHACTKCALAPTRTQTVFARGNPAAKLCFVGEAPGADEDAQGLPFVGRAGQLLDRMIGAMGLSPERDVYICNIIKCRPPGNRRPEPEEIATCIPYLHEQLSLVQPKVIVAMGNTAVAALLGTDVGGRHRQSMPGVGITKLRGQWKLYRGSTLVMPTYHPSYLIRPSAQQAEAKRQAWEDLQLVMKELGLAVPKK